MARKQQPDFAALFPQDPLPKEWMGPHLRRALGDIRIMERSPDAQLTSYAFQAAKKDAKDQAMRGKYSHASSSYHYAWDIAVRVPALVPDDDMKELFVGLAEVSLKKENYAAAADAAHACINCFSDFAKGYKLMSEAEERQSHSGLAARLLLDGMKNCTLTKGETVDFIVAASQQIAHVNKADCSQDPHARLLPSILPPLPRSSHIWNGIVQRLYDLKSFDALALITSGLTGPVTTCLHSVVVTECIAIDCSRMEIEQVTAKLDTQRMKDWGTRLAIFIVDHNGGVGRRSSDPLGVDLVKLALKLGCCELIEHMLGRLEGKRRVQANINEPNAEGNTPLHLVAQSTASVEVREELVSLLLRYGAQPGMIDKFGKMPQECVEQSSAVFKKLNKALSTQCMDLANSLKTKGNQAYNSGRYAEAVQLYEEAVAVIEKHPSQQQRELAILHCNLATAYTAMKDTAEAIRHAGKSVQLDSTYLKAYFRLGRTLASMQQPSEACEKFCQGLSCEGATKSDRVALLVEIASLLPDLPGDVHDVVQRVKRHLKECWPKVFASLASKGFWDAIRRLVLGPPFYVVDRVRTHGWDFADRYSETKRVEVGCAMYFKLHTTDSICKLVEEVKSLTGSHVRDWATDLVLALLLQGAELQTLLKADTETCYHVALRLCCLTGKLGLLRYILSIDDCLQEAVKAVDENEQTLLHLACILAGSHSDEVGRQLVQLLLKKGFDPTAKDCYSNQAATYLSPDSPSRRLLKDAVEFSKVNLQQILESKAQLGLWEELKALADKAKSVGKPLGSVFSNVSVADAVKATRLKCPKEELIRLLLEHGAHIPQNSRQVVQCALNNREIGVVEVLLDKGLHPKLLSPFEYTMDFSPVHFAFKIGLSIDRGNFRLFEKIMWGYGNFMKVDEHGNTLLHLALQEQDCQSSCQAVEFLVSKGLLEDNWNVHKMMAVDYLTESDDRQAEILMSFFINGMEEMRKDELQAATDREDMWFEECLEDHGEILESAETLGKNLTSSEPSERNRPGPNEAGQVQSENSSNKGEEEDGDNFEGHLWEVVLTEAVRKTLNSKDLTPQLKQKIFNRIKRLASGERRPKDFRSLQNAKPIRLYEANLTRGQRLIWEIAIAFSPSLSAGQRIYTDVIRIWDIVLDHSKIFASVQRIKQSLQRGKDCLSSVKLKAIRDSSRGASCLDRPGLYVKDDSGKSAKVSDLLLYPPASADETEYQILKFYDFTRNLEFSVLKNTAVKTDFLFRVTELEFEVINLDFNSPILLMGRSGTGKTVCCLYRQWTQFLKYWTEAKRDGYKPWLSWKMVSVPVADDAEDEELQKDGSRRQAAHAQAEKALPTTHPQLKNVHLHQVLVTKNPVLCSQMEKNFRELCHGEPVAIHHAAVERDQLPHKLYEGMDEYQFPLFVTSRQLILMLDASLPAPHFFERNDDGCLVDISPELTTPVLDLDNESDDDTDDDEEEEQAYKSEPSTGSRHLKQDQLREVTYEVFAQEIWPRLHKKIKDVKADYHPSLVWMEFQSFIKGSFQALTMPDGLLDQKSYEEFERKQAPNFTGNRAQMYALFELYTRYIRQRGLYDEADVLFHIFKRLRVVLQSEHSLPWVIHEGDISTV